MLVCYATRYDEGQNPAYCKLPLHEGSHLSEDGRMWPQGGYPPGRVVVRIAGLPSNNPGGLWYANVRNSLEDGLPVYEVVGDPNAVAVGRFKASLRKFLGV